MQHFEFVFCASDEIVRLVYPIGLRAFVFEAFIMLRHAREIALRQREISFIGQV
jgi:hypothetical protein